jgi:hypothetical protein
MAYDYYLEVENSKWWINWYEELIHGFIKKNENHHSLGEIEFHSYLSNDSSRTADKVSSILRKGEFNYIRLKIKNCTPSDKRIRGVVLRV